jgi:endoglucanase
LRSESGVYIDAGHSRWVSADDMAVRLNQVGVDHARGFSLNTANFFTTDEATGYSEAISAPARPCTRVASLRGGETIGP